MVPQQNKPIIAVIGELNLSEGSTQYELAYKVGKLIAEDRFAIAFKDKKNLYGPLNKATRAHSGFSIVIATEELNSDENNLCDQLYIAKDSLDVLSTLYEIADMVIALPGGIGVLQSVSFFWVVQSVSDKDKPLIL